MPSSAERGHQRSTKPKRSHGDELPRWSQGARGLRCNRRSEGLEPHRGSGDLLAKAALVTRPEVDPHSREE